MSRDSQVQCETVKFCNFFQIYICLTYLFPYFILPYLIKPQQSVNVLPDLAKCVWNLLLLCIHTLLTSK